MSRVNASIIVSKAIRKKGIIFNIKNMGHYIELIDFTVFEKEPIKQEVNNHMLSMQEKRNIAKEQSETIMDLTWENRQRCTLAYKEKLNDLYLELLAIEANTIQEYENKISRKKRALLEII